MSLKRAMVYKGLFTNDVIQKFPFLSPPPPLRHPSVITTQPTPSEQKMTSSWPDPHPLFSRFMLKIDINVESRPSYDTIFQYLLKLSVFIIMITIKFNFNIFLKF